MLEVTKYVNKIIPSTLVSKTYASGDSTSRCFYLAWVCMRIMQSIECSFFTERHFKNFSLVCFIVTVQRFFLEAHSRVLSGLGFISLNITIDFLCIDCNNGCQGCIFLDAL